MRGRRVAVALLLSAYSSMGLAQDLYYGLYITGVQYSDDRVNDTADATGATAKLGLDLFGPFSVEGRLGSTASAEVNATDVRVEYYGSAFLRAGIGREARLYGLVGGTYGRLDVDGAGLAHVDETESDVSYGAGLELYGTAHTAVAVEYLRHLETSDYYIDAANLGFTHRF